ncbi:MAG: metal ABC transporter permease [Bacteroidetes bacterium]|nr:metal ABC transporter permease [Bacteroidota bacterium]MCY4205899.1 metal ABC transporter permease [Bacteroidota bacterium]
MSTFQLEIQLVAAVVAAACALPGTFLMLRRMAMMSDAISHAILPGIVIGFFLTGNLSSPLLIVGGAATGLLTVVLVEWIRKTNRVREDAAIGLVFSTLFALGVVLIARFAGDIHLDTDAVLLGELAFVPFDRLTIRGHDLGPQALYTTAIVGLITLNFILLFYKELKLATFDSALCATLGFLPGVLHYILMGFISMTAVVAFDAVGSILVIALMVGPPVNAYLITNHFGRVILYSVLLSIIAAITGYWVAYLLDASIAGCMAVMVGIQFTILFCISPQQGLLATWKRKRYQKWQFAMKMLVIHIMQHENTPEAERECHIDHLQDHLAWEKTFAEGVVSRAVSKKLLRLAGEYLKLTPSGRELAREAIVNS